MARNSTGLALVSDTSEIRDNGREVGAKLKLLCNTMCLAFVLALTLVAARPTAKSIRHESPFSNQKVVLNLGQVQNNSGLVMKSSSAGGLIFPKGFEISVLVDNTCRQSHTDGDFLTKLVSNSQVYLSEQAYNFRFENEKSFEEFTQEMNLETCVIGIGDELRVKTQGEFTSDPLVAQQTQLGSLEVDEGDRLFFGSSFQIDRDVVIAVIDTGVDYNHPDLLPRMWRNAQNQFGRDVVNNDADPIDDNGHGTHVSGLAAAAAQNGIGGSGVMGFHSQIMAVKVLGADGSGTITDIANGIQFAIDNRADVINLSLGAAGVSATLENALIKAVQAGIVVVVAAGNDGVELTAANTFVPASYAVQIDGVLAVGAYDTTARGLSTFSNFSNTFVEIASPGSQGNSNTGIISTLPGGKYGPERGTSMASPIVAGAAALAIGVLRRLGLPATPAQVESILKEGAIKDSQLANNIVSGNRLNIRALAHYLQNTEVFQGTPGLESD